MSDSAASAFSKTNTKNVPCKATEAIAKGDVLNYDESAFDALSVEQPHIADGNTGMFAGVATADIDSGDQRAVLCKEGKVIAKVIGSTAAVQGAHLAVTDDQDYFTAVPEATGAILLSSGLNDDTDVHGPADGANAPEVWLKPPFGYVPNNLVMSNVIADISTAQDVWLVAPFPIELVAAYLVEGGAITVASSVTTISDGTNTAATLTATVAGSGAGTVVSGVLSATEANRRFTKGEKIKISCDGGSTDAARGDVVLVFKEF